MPRGSRPSACRWAVGGLAGHGIYYYVPDLLNHFTTSEMNALIAPRPHLSLAGNQDHLTPVAGLEKVDGKLRKVYAAEGHPENWKLLRHQDAHLENPEMRAEIQRWLLEKLQRVFPLPIAPLQCIHSLEVIAHGDDATRSLLPTHAAVLIERRVADTPPRKCQRLGCESCRACDVTVRP